MRTKLGFFDEIIGWIDQEIGTGSHVNSRQIGFGKQRSVEITFRQFRFGEIGLRTIHFMHFTLFERTFIHFHFIERSVIQHAIDTVNFKSKIFGLREITSDHFTILKNDVVQFTIAKLYVAQIAIDKHAIGKINLLDVRKLAILEGYIFISRYVEMLRGEILLNNTVFDVH